MNRTSMSNALQGVAFKRVAGRGEPSDDPLYSSQPAEDGLATTRRTRISVGVAFFTDVFANRNETKHLPYGEGTLRAEPLAAALRKFKRPATVISESPDEASRQAIRSILEENAAARPSTGASSARRAR
jgi:hypothetical protein